MGLTLLFLWWWEKSEKDILKVSYFKRSCWEMFFKISPLILYTHNTHTHTLLLFQSLRNWISMRLFVITFLYWKCPWDLWCTLVGTFIFLMSNVLLQCIKVLSFSFLTNCMLTPYLFLIFRRVFVVICESLFCVHESINQ